MDIITTDGRSFVLFTPKGDNRPVCQGPTATPALLLDDLKEQSLPA
ncbi:MAG: hypothetical protein ACP5EP_09235 [Acidobacteriaceae bacterium]